MARKIFLFVFLLFIQGGLAWANGPLKPSRFINVNGVQVAIYESRGTRGPGILLIHGNTSSANAFAEIMKSAFARKHRVVALDMPGYGRSDDAPFYNVAVFTQAIVAVAKKTGVDDGVIVGWSLGGDLALQASSQLPNVKGYFLLGTAPVGFAPDLPPPFLTPEESYAGEAVNYGFFGNLTPEQVKDYVRAFFRPDFHRIPRFFFTDGLRTDPDTRNAVFAAATGQDPTFQDEVQIVKNLDVPLALIVGDEDSLVRLAYLQGLAPQIPTLWKNKIIVLKNTGHAVQWERPAQTISLLREFLRGLLRKSANHQAVY